MDNITNIKNSQITTLLNSTNKTNLKAEETAIQEKTKSDFLSISNQIDILEQSQAKKESNKIDFNKLEQKLGIDSDKWGVEAVSDDIFNFTKNIFESYKINHEGEENSQVLKSFYELAKKSVTQGYNEALNFLGALPEDVASLAKGTFERTIEKLDQWFENGGKDIEIEDSNNQIKENSISQPETIEKTQISTQELLKEAENVKNEVVDSLKQQGLYLKEKSSKKANYEFKG